MLIGKNGAQLVRSVSQSGRMQTHDAPTTPTPQGELLDTDQAARIVGLSPRTLKLQRLTGRGPRFVRLSRQTVRYSPADLAEFIASRTINPEASK